jgi:hypothetical protein
MTQENPPANRPRLAANHSDPRRFLAVLRHLNEPNGPIAAGHTPRMVRAPPARAGAVRAHWQPGPEARRPPQLLKRTARIWRESEGGPYRRRPPQAQAQARASAKLLLVARTVDSIATQSHPPAPTPPPPRGRRQACAHHCGPLRASRGVSTLWRMHAGPAPPRPAPPRKGQVRRDLRILRLKRGPTRRCALGASGSCRGKAEAARGWPAYFYLNLSTDTYTPVRTQQVMHTSSILDGAQT